MGLKWCRRCPGAPRPGSPARKAEAFELGAGLPLQQLVDVDWPQVARQPERPDLDEAGVQPQQLGNTRRRPRLKVELGQPPLERDCAGGPNGSISAAPPCWRVRSEAIAAGMTPDAHSASDDVVVASARRGHPVRSLRSERA